MFDAALILYRLNRVRGQGVLNSFGQLRTPSVSFADRPSAFRLPAIPHSGRQAPRPQGGSFLGDITMLFLQNVLSFVIIYLSLRESESSFGKVFTFEKVQPDLPPRGRGTARRRWKEFPAGGGRSSRRRWKAFPTEVVTEGFPAGGGRRYPQIPFKSPNVFMAYVAMPQAAASPRPALSKPPATAA